MPESSLRGSSVISGKLASRGVTRESHYFHSSNSSKTSTNNISALGYLNPSGPTLGEYFLAYRSAWNGFPEQSTNQINQNLGYLDYPPLCLDLELAAFCDLACPYCFRQTYFTPDKFMSYDLAISLIDQAASMGIPSIKFNWRGEPLFHKNLPELIAYAKSKGILDTIVNTNATQLDSSMSRRLIESGLDFIIFSFDGGTKETYEKNRIGRFTSNKFDDVYSNIRNFDQIKSDLNSPFPWSKIQMILTKDSYPEQDSFIQLFKDCVDEVVVNQYSERGMSLDILNPEQKTKYHSLLHQHNLPEGTPFMVLDDGSVKVSIKRLPCKQPFQRMLVTFDGRVSMCCYDWGSMHTIGYVANDCFQDLDYDKSKIKLYAEQSKPGFEKMKNAIMPPQYFAPNKVISSLYDIWNAEPVKEVRRSQVLSAQLPDICQACTFKDTYQWI